MPHGRIVSHPDENDSKRMGLFFDRETLSTIWYYMTFDDIVPYNMDHIMHNGKCEEHGQDFGEDFKKMLLENEFNVTRDHEVLCRKDHGIYVFYLK